MLASLIVWLHHSLHGYITHCMLVSLIACLHQSLHGCITHCMDTGANNYLRQPHLLTAPNVLVDSTKCVG